jgi:hypothetical protein
MTFMIIINCLDLGGVVGSHQESEQPCSISTASLLPSEEANSFASRSWSTKLQKQKVF